MMIIKLVLLMQSMSTHFTIHSNILGYHETQRAKKWVSGLVHVTKSYIDDFAIHSNIGYHKTLIY